VIAAAAASDCEIIQDCIGAAVGPGLEYDDAANQIKVKISTAAGNAAAIGVDGGIYAAGGGGSGGLTFVSTQDTPCIDLSGQGTSGAPLSAAPILDPNAGQLLSCTATGLRAGLTVGLCGLTGNGSAASPLAAKVQAWPYSCPADANAGGVYCDSTGTLRSEPRGRITYTQDTLSQTFSATAVPSATDTVVVTRNILLNNPDPCRDASVIIEIEVDVDFNLPANSGAAYGMGTDEMVYLINRGGSAANDGHIQTTKVYNRDIPAGGSLNEPLNITMGRGSGGATYNRIQHFMRAWIINL